ncbi:MAG: hypothetical protein NTZ05_06080 [Chloroflexi bacterium]|nr:hypothetical protein [Chloroflexota bacterium]
MVVAFADEESGAYVANRKSPNVSERAQIEAPPRAFERGDVGLRAHLLKNGGDARVQSWSGGDGRLDGAPGGSEQAGKALRFGRLMKPRRRRRDLLDGAVVGVLGLPLSARMWTHRVPLSRRVKPVASFSACVSYNRSAGLPEV